MNETVEIIAEALVEEDFQEATSGTPSTRRRRKPTATAREG